MNHNTEQEPLLTDVTLEGADFRAVMLDQTLRVVRRRRHWRQAQRVTVVCLVLGIAAMLVYWPAVRHSSPLAVQSNGRPYWLVQTTPLQPGAIIATRPFSNFVGVDESPIKIVQTIPGGGNFRLLNDDELLALVGPRPAMLIRIDANSERLIFVNPDDEKIFQPR